MSELTNCNDKQREQCAWVDFLSYLQCEVCGCDYEPRRKDQRTCGKPECRFARPRLTIRADEHTATIGKRNKSFRRINRDKYLSTDAQHRGPLNHFDTSVKKISIDRGYKPSPHNVHVDSIVKKNFATPLDLQEARLKEKHKSKLGKTKTNFCPQCAAYVNQNHEHTEE